MTDMAFADGFDVPTREAWLRLVEKALKGGDFERRLVARTADGLRIEPLYTRAGAAPAATGAVPGVAPFTRGNRAATGSGWDIRQLHASADPAGTNAAILEDLAGGATSITLQLAAPGQFGLDTAGDAMSLALRGVLLDVCPVALRAGEYTPDAAGALMALWRTAGLADAACRGAFDYDPIANLAATGALYHPLPKALDVAANLVRTTLTYPHVTALRAAGPAYHEGGASEAQELAAVLSTIVAYLRAGEAAGLAPASVLGKITVALAIDADQFLGLAKLRAARQLIWRVAEACGAAAAAQVPVNAETSLRMMTRRDPWVNMLRTTMACAAAAMGGADAITVLPYTFALGGADAFARRIARNTHHVLMEESGLARVTDPAGGAWYVEQLTADLAAKAWALFQAIEGQGGIGAALQSGFLQDEIGKVAAARAKLVATGRLELTGASAFPRLGDDCVTVRAHPMALAADLNGERVTPLEPRRLAEPFEALRDRADAFAARSGQPLRVFLASLGPLAVHAARATWIRNFLAAGGIDVVAGQGLTNSADAGKAFADSGALVACLCSADSVYAELGEATAGVLKQAGATRVYLAGRPKEQEAALKAAGVDEFIFAGVDAIAMLGKIQEALDVR